MHLLDLNFLAELLTYYSYNLTLFTKLFIQLIVKTSNLLQKTCFKTEKIKKSFAIGKI